MLFYKVLILFWGVLEHALMVVWKLNDFSHNLHYYNIFLPSLTQTARLVPGLIKAHLTKNEMCCDWLAVPVRCDEQLRWRFSIALPLAKTASSSILPYQFRPREYWSRGLRRTFARTDIARHIKVVMLLLFLAKSCFRWDVNNSLKITALTCTDKCNGNMYYVYCSLILTV